MSAFFFGDCMILQVEWCFIRFDVDLRCSAGAVCIDSSNKFMTTAQDSSFETSLDIVGDLQTFVDGTVKVG